MPDVSQGPLLLEGIMRALTLSLQQSQSELQSPLWEQQSQALMLRDSRLRDEERIDVVLDERVL